MLIIWYYVYIIAERNDEERDTIKEYCKGNIIFAVRQIF